MRPFAVFVGLPGSGKSTMARGLAQRENLSHVDSDDLIVAEAGMSIPGIFDAYGEQGFREIEARVIASTLSNFDGVLSLGGGAVTTASVRRALRGHRVILITADEEVLLERVTRHPSKRPLLAKDPEGTLARLREEREPLYRQVATHEVASGDNDPEETLDRVQACLSESDAISVGDYDVYIGSGLGGDIARHACGASAAMIVHPTELQGSADHLVALLGEQGIPAFTHLVPSGETQKQAEQMIRAWDVLGEAKIGRDGLIIGLGGGATTDLAGFIAATWLRGIDLIQVPTTLLGMVDAAVGGKTGIDTAAGKNLVGAFYKPVGVFVDIDHLATLPIDELRAGLGEVIKCGWIDDPVILDLIGPELLDPSHPHLLEAIERSIRVKARIVTEDFKESGKREFLNFGHTLAHAIEKIENYTVRHGEAVAIGSVYAAGLGERLGLSPAGLTQAVRESFDAVGLPTSYRSGRRGDLVDAMFSDKKVRGGTLRFVLLAGQGEPIIASPDREFAMDGLAEIES